MTSWSRYFDRFEYVCGTSGKAGNIQGRKIEGGNPFEAPRARDYPLPPLTDPPTSVLFAKAAKELGYQPYPLPASNASQPYVNPLWLPARALQFLRLLQRLRLHQLFQGLAADHHPAGALPQEEFRLRTNAHVLKVNTDSTGNKATGVTYIDANGREVEQPATMVVLAAFHLHNVRLMLSSGIGKPYDPDTGEGVVGRNFCYQLIDSINLFFDKNTYINQFMGAGGVGQAIEEFNADNFDHGPLNFIGGGVIWGRQTGNGPVRGIPLPPARPLGAAAGSRR